MNGASFPGSTSRVSNLRVMFDEFVECEAVVRADPQFLAAIRKRGITDPKPGDG